MPPRSTWPALCRLAIVMAVAAGLAGRIALVRTAPEHSFLWDHIDLMAWSDWAYEHGPTTLYDLPTHRLINVSLPPSFAPRGTVEPYPSLNACNYPPLWGYVSWLQGAVWRLIDRHVVTSEARPEIAQFAGVTDRQVTSRVANTPTARTVNAALPTLADFLMAWGVLRLVRVLRRPQPPGWPEVAAVALVLLGPPFALNSAFWTQTDSCIACPLVWCLVFLLDDRPIRAGLCCGTALMLKASAVLILPVLAFVFVALVFRAGSSLRQAASLWKGAVAAAAVMVVLAAPYMTADHGHPEGGSLRWLQRSYVAPLTEQFPYTTLKAFNIWWLDFLAHGQVAASLEPAGTTWNGMTKARLGSGLFVVAVALAAVISAWRWRWSSHAVVAFAALLALAAFAFPTRVHERYILYCLPFVTTLAVVFRSWLPTLFALLLAGSFEMTWFLWLAPPDAGLDSPAQSANAAAWSLLLAVLVLAGFVVALTTPLFWRDKATSTVHAPQQSAPLFGD